MGNCLVTKLKSAVDNSELEKLGVIKLHVLPHSEADKNYYRFTVMNSAPIEVDVVGSGYVGLANNDITHTHLTLNVTDPLIGDSNVVYFSQGTYDIELSTKYKINSFYALGGNNSMRNGIKVKLNDLQYIPLNELRLTFSNSEGDIKYLPNTLVSVEFEGNSEIVGDFSVFGNFPKIGNIRVALTNIKGTLESFVAGQRRPEVGNTTGSITFVNGAATLITFNGVKCRGTGNDTVTWDATTITYNGTTITA